MLLAGFIITPIILDQLGQDVFGFYHFLLGIIAYINLAEIGVAGSLTAIFSKYLQDKREHPSILIITGVRAYLRVLPVFVFAWVATYALIIYTAPEVSLTPFQIQISYVLLGINVLFIILTPLKTYLECSHQSNIVDGAMLFHFIVFAVFRVLFAYMDMKLFGQVLAASLSMIALNSVLYYFIHKQLKKSLLNFKKKSPKAIFDEVWQQNWNHVIFNTAGRICLGADNVIVGFMLSPAQLTVFFLTQKLPTVILHQLNAISHATWVPLVQTALDKDYSGFQRKFNEVNKFIMMMGLSAIVSVIIFNRFFITTWVGADSYGGLWLTFFSCFVALFTSIYSFWGWIVVGSGHVETMNKVVIISAVINITLSILLTHFVGIIGPLVGSFCTYLFFQMPFTLPIFKKIYRLSILSLLKSLLPAMVFAAGYIYLGLLASDQWLVGSQLGWFSLGWMMPLTSVVYFILGFLILTNSEEKTIWKQRLFRYFKRS